MFFQKVVKGIHGLDRPTVQHMLDNGIISNWWKEIGTITPVQIKELLNENNADLHINHYNELIPAGHPLSGFVGKKFGQVSPFISTSAGAIQRKAKSNFLFDPVTTAIRFATKNLTSDGVVFYAYLMTIGKQTVELEQFSEEVRELNVYTKYSKYQTQGEIMAKVIIPSIQIEKAEFYKGATAKSDYAAGRRPKPVDQILNPGYLLPESYSNIKELLQ